MLAARLAGHVALEAQPNGEIAARFYGHSVILGRFSAAASHRAQALRAGLPLSEFASGARGVDKEIAFLVQRLARLGLLEFRLGRSLRGADQVIIEPQVPDYWPRMPHLNETDTLALSRFAYLPTRQRSGAGVAMLRRIVSNLRSQCCGHPDPAGCTATAQNSPST